MLEPSPSGPSIKIYLTDLQHLKFQRVIHERASPKTNWPTDGNRWTRIKTDKSFAGLILHAFAANLHRSLQATPLDIGCCLQYGSFEQTRTLRISSHDESLIFFVLRLLERLRAMGPAPAIDLMQYARSLQSFK